MKFASLGSGSRGNATLIQAGETCILLDCGFSMREFEKRCAAIQFDPKDISAVVVTHEHLDHIKGVGPLARKYAMPVWMTHGTWRSARCGDIPELRLFGSHTEAIQIGDIRVAPHAVPHDAREPVQCTYTYNDLRLGILTDVGSLTPRLVDALNGVDALLLECNHDTDMLREGPYPPRLQARVGGSYGHLSNEQAVELLSRIDHRRLRHLVVGHLSEKNNAPQRVRDAVLGFSSALEEVFNLLEQDETSGWFTL